MRVRRRALVPSQWDGVAPQGGAGELQGEPIGGGGLSRMVTRTDAIGMGGTNSDRNHIPHRL